MVGNLEAGFQVSANGTAGIPGRGGLLTDCVIDGNLRDGISIGNTRGPYTVRGNRISGNGGYGYHHQDLGEGNRAVAEEMVIEDNDIRGNALDGIRFRPAVAGHHHPRQPAPQQRPAVRAGRSGGGESVRYGTEHARRPARRLAGGRPPGQGRAGRPRFAVVASNDATALVLAPNAPASTPPGARHPRARRAVRVAGRAGGRAGITLTADCDSVTIRGNLIRDSGSGTQSAGIWITGRGSCVNCRVVENDLDGNRVGIRADTSAVGGHWARQPRRPVTTGHRDGTSPGRSVTDRPGLVGGTADQARSNRSSSITLVQAATKSVTNFSRASSLA